MREKEGGSRWRPGRPAAIHMAATGLIALVGVMTLAPLAVPPAYADHDDKYVVCPSPILEGNIGYMQVRRPGYSWISVTVFTYDGAHTAEADNFVGYDRVTMESESGSDTLWVPVVTNEDSSPEHDETIAIGYWISGMWHACVVTILDDDIPEASGVEITSNPALGLTYRAGETIDVTVTFDQAVDVEGIPTLSLYLGDGDDTWRGAEYRTGSGTRFLTFRYGVQVTDRDRDGVTVGGAGMDDDRNPTYGFSGRINARGTDVPVDYTHPGIGDSGHHRVDGRPYVHSVGVISAPADHWDAYRTNQSIEIAMNFDTDVEVDGNVLAGLYVGLQDANWDEAWRYARYLRSSGTDTLVFGYTVRPGDMDTEGIMISLRTPDRGFGGDGTIKASGTNVERNPYYLGTGHLADHQVDTEPPAISSVSIESRPRNGEAYGAGEIVSVEVAFSERVTTSGDLQLELDIGGATRKATLHDGTSGTEPVGSRSFSDVLVFRHEVLEGDTDTDGIGISPNSLRLNGGSIQDIAGNTSGLAHDAVTADPVQKVDNSLDN